MFVHPTSSASPLPPVSPVGCFSFLFCFVFLLETPPLLKYTPSDCYPFWVCHCLLVTPPHQSLAHGLSTVPVIRLSDHHIHVDRPTSDLSAYRPPSTHIRNLLPWSNFLSAGNCSTYKLFRKMNHHLLTWFPCVSNSFLTPLDAPVHQPFYFLLYLIHVLPSLSS